MALVKLLLPLEYMAVFALCAKDPVKERRAHARQCLLKNISVRREYIKQNPMAQGKHTLHAYRQSLVTLLGTSVYSVNNDDRNVIYIAAFTLLKFLAQVKNKWNYILVECKTEVRKRT